MDYSAIAAKLMEQEPPVSQPFMQGLAAVLRNRVDLTPVTSPYVNGSVENDAFFAGRMRAHNEFRNLLKEVKGDHEAAVARLQQFAAGRRVA